MVPVGRRAAWLGGGLALLSACSEGQQLWIAPPPSDGQAGSVVFVFTEGGATGPAFAVAAARSSSGIVRLSLEQTPWAQAPPDSPQVSALSYGGGLEGLELRAGVLPDPPEPRLCALGAPLNIYDASIVQGRSTEWIKRAELSPRERRLVVGDLDGAACRRPDLCRALRVEILELDSPGNIDVIIPLDDQRALLGLGSYSRFLMTSRGRVEPALTGVPSFSGFYTSQQELWAGGQGGAIVRGPLSGPFQAVPLPVDDLIVGAISVDDASGTVLAAATFEDLSGQAPLLPSRITVWRWNGGSWDRLYEAVVGRGTYGTSTIQWVGPGRALISYGDVDLLEYQGGDQLLRRPALSFDTLLDVQIETMLNHPRWGLLLGGSDGHLYYPEPDGDQVRPAPGVGALSPLQLASALGDTVLVGGVGGFLQQHQPLGAPCPVDLSAGSDASEGAAVGNALVVGGGNIEENRNNRVTWVVPK